jgi:hypothetical protein
VVIDGEDLEWRWCVVFTTLWEHDQRIWRFSNGVMGDGRGMHSSRVMEGVFFIDFVKDPLT